MGSSRFIRGLTWLVVVAKLLAVGAMHWLVGWKMLGIIEEPNIQSRDAALPICGLKLIIEPQAPDIIGEDESRLGSARSGSTAS